MIGRRRPKEEPIKVPVTVKVPREFLTPCKTCFWRFVEICGIELDPIEGECAQYKEAKK